MKTSNEPYTILLQEELDNFAEKNNFYIKIKNDEWYNMLRMYYEYKNNCYLKPIYVDNKIDHYQVFRG
jgi:hypothetical protein